MGLSAGYTEWLAANKLSDGQLAALIYTTQREIPVSANDAMRVLLELVQLRERVAELEVALGEQQE